MNLTSRNVILMLLLMLSIILLPVLSGAGMIGLAEDDDAPEADFALIDPVYWMRIPFSQMSAGLVLGMSIFALVVVYRGDRSNRARFNDRTIADNDFSKDIFFSLKTALHRAVFNFLLFVSRSNLASNDTLDIFLPIPILSTRRY